MYTVSLVRAIYANSIMLHSCLFELYDSIILIIYRNLRILEIIRGNNIMGIV